MFKEFDEFVDTFETTKGYETGKATRFAGTKFRVDRCQCGIISRLATELEVEDIKLCIV